MLTKLGTNILIFKAGCSKRWWDVHRMSLEMQCETEVIINGSIKIHYI